MQASGAVLEQEMGQGDPEAARFPWRRCTRYLEEALYCDYCAADCRSPPGEAISHCKVGNKGMKGAVYHIKSLSNAGCSLGGTSVHWGVSTRWAWLHILSMGKLRLRAVRELARSPVW